MCRLLLPDTALVQEEKEASVERGFPGRSQRVTWEEGAWDGTRFEVAFGSLSKTKGPLG